MWASTNISSISFGGSNYASFHDWDNSEREREEKKRMAAEKDCREREEQKVRKLTSELEKIHQRKKRWWAELEILPYTTLWGMDSIVCCVN